MSGWPDPHAGYGPVPYSQTYVYLPAQHRSSTAHLVFAWLAAVLSAGYMLPWAIGATRNRTNCAATALVNFFFGWTVIGWVIALVMACGSEPAQPVVVQTTPSYPPGQPVPLLPPDMGSYAAGHYGTDPYGTGSPAALNSAPPAAYPPYPSPAGQPTAAEVTMPLPAYEMPPYGMPPNGAPGNHPRRDDLR